MRGDLHRCYTIAKVSPEGQAGATLTLDHSLPAQAGQFVMVWLPGLNEKPFSIVDDDPLTLSISALGPFSTVMVNRTVGDKVWVRGPYGHGFQLMGRRPLLIGGGCGVAPLALLSRQLAESVEDLSVIVGASTASRLMLVERFRALGCRVRLATDDGSAGHRGTVVEAALPVIDSGTVDAVYACGPEGMLITLAQFCTLTGVRCQLSLERYMRCGVGLCGSCHCGGLLVCHDGPVLDAESFLSALT